MPVHDFCVSICSFGACLCVRHLVKGNRTIYCSQCERHSPTVPRRHCQPATSPSERGLIWWSINTWRIDESQGWKYPSVVPHLIPSFITHDLIIDESCNSVSDVLWTGWKWVCNPLPRHCSLWELSQWQKIITIIMTKSVTTLRSVPLHNVNISAPELSPALCSALWWIRPHPAFMFHSPETLNSSFILLFSSVWDRTMIAWRSLSTSSTSVKCCSFLGFVCLPT